LTFTATYRGEEISSTQDATLTLKVKHGHSLWSIGSDVLSKIRDVADIVAVVIALLPK
jgi:hypothetical protein